MCLPCTWAKLCYEMLMLAANSLAYVNPNGKFLGAMGRATTAAKGRPWDTNGGSQKEARRVKIKGALEPKGTF